MQVKTLWLKPKAGLNQLKYSYHTICFLYVSDLHQCHKSTIKYGSMNT